MRPPLRMIAAAGALGLAASAPAVAAWAPPQPASTGRGDAHSPDVAVNGRGDAAAVWVQEARERGRIVASARSAGGTWSRPAPISPPGMSAVDPQVAIDAAGRVVAVWRQVVRTRVLRGRRQAVYVARGRERRPGGGWSAVATLSDDRQKIGPPELAIDGRGVAVATWHWGTGTRAGTPGHVGEVQVAEKRPGRAWGPARRASSPGRCRLDTRLPHAAAAAGGHAVVWWQCDLAGGRSVTDAIGRGPSPGAWRAERRLPFAAPGDQAVDLAVAPDGGVLALSAVPGGPPRLWRASAPLGRAGALSLVPLALVAPRLVARDDLRLAVAASAEPAVAGWILGCSRGLCGGLGLADPGAGTAPVAVTELVGPFTARGGVSVAAAADGGAVAVALGSGVVVATSRPPGAGWAALEQISAPGAVDDAVVGVDAAGGAVAYWRRGAAGRSVVERAELAPAP